MPDETARVLFAPAGKASGGRHSMKRIVLVSREPAKHKNMIFLMETLFPDCRVEIITKMEEDSDLLSSPLENDAHSTGVGCRVSHQD